MQRHNTPRQACQCGSEPSARRFWAASVAWLEVSSASSVLESRTLATSASSPSRESVVSDEGAASGMALAPREGSLDPDAAGSSSSCATPRADIAAAVASEARASAQRGESFADSAALRSASDCPDNSPASRAVTASIQASRVFSGPWSDSKRDQLSHWRTSQSISSLSRAGTSLLRDTSADSSIRGRYVSAGGTVAIRVPDDSAALSAQDLVLESARGCCIGFACHCEPPCATAIRWNL